MRTIEYYDHNTTLWSGIPWPTVVSGMMVRMYEEDGTPIKDGTGLYEMFVCLTAYTQTVSGVGDVWTIDVNDPEPSSVPRREI